jgi:4-hydroxy-tetrahydrodipicolinate reductase
MGDPQGTVAGLASILRTGKNVVNATWPALLHPRALGDAIYQELQHACVDGGSSFYTGGLDPGWGTSGLALGALTLCSEVRNVRMYELLDYATWDDPRLVGVYGFGQPDPAACRVLEPGFLSNTWGSTIHLIADAIGAYLDDVTETHELVYADEPFDIPSAHIGSGTIAGMRFAVRGLRAGEPVIAVEHVVRLRERDFPDVPFSQGGYRVEVDGEPHVRVDLALSSNRGSIADTAYVAVAMAIVNAIPQVCDAQPGVLRYTDLRPHPSRHLVGLS